MRRKLVLGRSLGFPKRDAIHIDTWLLQNNEKIWSNVKVGLFIGKFGQASSSLLPYLQEFVA